MSLKRAGNWNGQGKHSRTKEKNARKEDEPVDYGRYRLSRREYLQSIGMGIVVDGMVSYACYRSWVVFGILLLPACMVLPYLGCSYWKNRRLEQLELQFKEMIRTLSASLSAGYSVENALEICRNEMSMMYGEDGMIVKELEYMLWQLRMNQSVEAVILDFAQRSGVEEIQDFAHIFAIAKRSGGRLVAVISHTVGLMQDRYQVRDEIRILTASRRFEQKIMRWMPFLILLYVDGTSPGFFDLLYTTWMGRMIMSACLAIYVLSCYLSEKILDIKVG